MIVSSNKNFGLGRRSSFADPVAVPRHGRSLARPPRRGRSVIMWGDSYRLKGKGDEVTEPATHGPLSAQVSTGAGRAAFDCR